MEKGNMYSSELIIGIIVLGILVVLLVIIGINRARRQRKPSQSSESTSFNAVLENELSKGLEGETLIEILGLENLPTEDQAEVIEGATSVIEKRCLNRVLESLNEQEKQDFVNILEGDDPEVVNNFLKSKHIDQRAILLEEVLRFKREIAEEFS
jgi:hypothetical protein